MALPLNASRLSTAPADRAHLHLPPLNPRSLDHLSLQPAGRHHEHHHHLANVHLDCANHLAPMREPFAIAGNEGARPHDRPRPRAAAEATGYSSSSRKITLAVPDALLLTPLPSPRTQLSKGSLASLLCDDTSSALSFSPDFIPPPPAPGADESIPEAALHLLRLSIPTASTASVTTCSTTPDDEFDRNVDSESDDTSVRSDVDDDWKDPTYGVRHKVSRHRTSSLSSNAPASDLPLRAPTGRGAKGPVYYHGMDCEKNPVSRPGSSKRDFEDDTSFPPSKRSKPVENTATRSITTLPTNLPRLNIPSFSTLQIPHATPLPSPSASSTSSSRSMSRRAPLSFTAPNRSFPFGVTIDFAFPRIYRAFPISTAIEYPRGLVNCVPSEDVKAQMEEDFSAVNFLQPAAGVQWNKTPVLLNLYTPRFVKGTGDSKAGLCPVCIEPKERGGEGEEKWLKLKNSSYVYHMSYAHGISNLSGLPFSPPAEIRVVPIKKSTRDGRTQMKEGLCHRCEKWVPLLSTKNVDAVIPELIWWKHAKGCHGITHMQGEGDYYVQDALYRTITTATAHTHW